MKICISQQIIPKSDFREFKQISKEFESNIIPHKGDKIADRFYKEPYEYDVVECTIDYQENKCYVTLASINVETKDEVNEQIKISKLHGWKDRSVL